MSTEHAFYFDLIADAPLTGETDLDVLATQWLRLRRA